MGVWYYRCWMVVCAIERDDGWLWRCRCDKAGMMFDLSWIVRIINTYEAVDCDCMRGLGCWASEIYMYWTVIIDCSISSMFIVLIKRPKLKSTHFSRKENYFYKWGEIHKLNCVSPRWRRFNGTLLLSWIFITVNIEAYFLNEKNS